MSDPWATTVIGNKANAKIPKVVRNETDLNKARRTGAAIQTDKKLTQLNKATSGDHARIAKLDRDNEVAPPAKIAPAVGKAIIQGRNDKGLTQKDLAQKINEAPRVLQDYESGKAVPSQVVLGKLERVLEIKLRGADIGKKLEPKGKKKEEKKDDKSAPSGSK
ncbi:multiprotein-bridging factor 1 [Tulasnella sp. UAMH 9824]|nr:multiprotein-bridging factor 1 [Tulasnella sp. UAMH 9824]